MNNIYKKIYKKIKSYDEIVLARHVGPDPDAIASQIALRDSIKKTFPNKKVYAVGNSVAKFKYYGVLDKIEQLLTIWKGIGKVSLLYQDHALAFTIADTPVYNQPYQCLEEDFLIAHAEQFRQSANALSDIHHCLIHFI